MRKRFVSLLLCIWLLLGTALPVAAKEKEEPQTRHYTISNLENFLAFAEKCRLDSFSQSLEVSLVTDLDLTGADFSGIPIFNGTFEGNGHTIRGLDLTQEGTTQGFFRYLTDTAVVQDLKLEGKVHPGGTRSEVGSLAGRNAGKILNCSFSGTVSGNSYVGGLVGINEVSGIMEECRVSGNLSGSHFIGGIAGQNSGVIRSSVNEAKINDTPQQNDVSLSDITLDALTGSESINTVTDIGGIAGTSNGVIRDCVNHGNVGYQHMGYNIGGIAGTQAGMIQGCENYGEIRGRKEVGGIVGQMEPTALIEYKEDALQMLKRQINNMGSTLNATMSNLQGIAESVVGQVGTLRTHVTNAKNAVDTLIPDKEDPHLPDLDTIKAAKNNISSSISGMSQALEGMDATAYGAMGKMSTNLDTLQGQINTLRSTLGNVSQTLGGSLKDVSDKDTDEDTMGKVADCVNHAPVLGDRNTGGIVGAMSLENDLDHEDDWQINGNNSLNFESELRAVVLNCTNLAKVTVKKQNAGGIVGWQPMGLVKDSLNSGTLDAGGADYVGGIAGRSTAYIRGSSAKCEIAGTNYVGGIAGSGAVVTDCRSMVKLSGGIENLGAILGEAGENHTQEDDPIAGNLYLSVDREWGAIDGISYDGLAQPVSMEQFLLLEDLPEMFRSVTVSFRYANGTQRSFSVPLGGSFSQQWVPQIPPKAGQVASWKDLAQTDMSRLLFDVTFEPEYIYQNTVVSSDNTRLDQPLLLLQGSFTQDARVTAEALETEVPTESGEDLLETWSISVSGVQELTEGRFRLPEECDADNAKVLLLDDTGTWYQAEQRVDGSCIVFTADSGLQGLALIQQHSVPWLWIGAGAAVLALVLLLLYRYRDKLRKK